mgnify:CR=1 FL=1
MGKRRALTVKKIVMDKNFWEVKETVYATQIT